MQAARTVAIRANLSHEVTALLEKCEQLRDKYVVDATHRFGAVAALLLVPSFIVGFFGQNVDFPDWPVHMTLGVSTALVVGSTASLWYLFKRRRWL